MSTDLGLGNAGFGSTSYGFGSPAQVNSITPALLRKEDGTYGDVVKIDTTSGDYALDEHGNKIGWDSLSQRVYMALFTKLGSSAVAELGIEAFPETIRDDTNVRIRNAVNTALRALIFQGLIVLVDVIVNRVKDSGVQVEVRWRDITTGKINATFV